MKIVINNDVMLEMPSEVFDKLIFKPVKRTYGTGPTYEIKEGEVDVSVVGAGDVADPNCEDDAVALLKTVRADLEKAKAKTEESDRRYRREIIYNTNVRSFTSKGYTADQVRAAVDKLSTYEIIESIFKQEMLAKQLKSGE
jgi:hypothetical protein